MFWNVFDQPHMYIYTPESNNSILDHNSVSICSDNYLFYVDRWLIKEEECIFRLAIMKNIYMPPSPMVPHLVIPRGPFPSEQFN